MGEKRVTKRERFIRLGVIVKTLGKSKALDETEVSELLAFIANEIELIDRKHRKTGLTKEQRINVGIKQDIVHLLNSTKEMRAGEIALALGHSTQKVTALCSQLVKDGVLVRNEGKIVTFSVNESKYE